MHRLVPRRPGVGRAGGVLRCAGALGETQGGEAAHRDLAHVDVTLKKSRNDRERLPGMDRENIPSFGGFPDFTKPSCTQRRPPARHLAGSSRRGAKAAMQYAVLVLILIIHSIVFTYDALWCGSSAATIWFRTCWKPSRHMSRTKRCAGGTHCCP
ncbi:protein of unknown function [Methylococcus capsulatus]|uniref:Uncharacterized protein n=1 Tax=Methylococcus capsulatus TaxID=414 RepID=A0AA35XVQ3_METCP|nr:protein of unknown function [Methylococcus capsulatus]